LEGEVESKTRALPKWRCDGSWKETQETFMNMNELFAKNTLRRQEVHLSTSFARGVKNATGAQELLN